MVLIGKYGLKIKIFEASTVLEYNAGVREHYEYKDAMLTNSLFLDFLKENGLKTYNDKSTRDVICLEFNYGTRSSQKELDHLVKTAKKARNEYRRAFACKDKVVVEKTVSKRDRLTDLFYNAHFNKDLYKQMNTDELRRVIYNNGITVRYITRKKDGTIKSQEDIHYKMLFRSTGKAKKGSCMFIVDRLYKEAIDFLRMGIKLPKRNAPIVEVSAYSSLIASGIVGRIKINPENILVLKDVDRYFRTKVVSVETDEDRNCISREIEDYELSNTLFDGQALIDSRLFNKWISDEGETGNGYLLLRHHFCKMAAFCADIQGFFKDYCETHGMDYGTATVNDIWGNPHYLRDVELVTTDNAMKWMKFDVSYEIWCDKVRENGSLFGVVKTAHRSKLGEVQRMSYQMVNALSEEKMPEIAQKSVDYTIKLKLDDYEYLKYLKRNMNFSNDYSVLIALCEQDPEFIRNWYFRQRRYKIISEYIFKLRSGEIIQDAENLVIVGSPYAMLLYAASGNEKDCDLDDTFVVEDGCIQCYTPRFGINTYLAGFRSPFNSRNNIDYLHNVYDERLEKYFGFTRQIIAVNMIGTDFQDRNNGSDQDSDSLYVTSQPEIVECAKEFYTEYPTIVNLIPKDKNVYDNTMDDYAKLDSSLAKSQLAIGLASNLAQIAQSYSYTFKDDKYQRYACILAVLAQVAIDNSKRRYDLDLSKSIDTIKKDMDIKYNGYPAFWGIVKKECNKSSINKEIHCPMNYLANLKFPEVRQASSTLPMETFFIKTPLERSKTLSNRIEKMITKYSFDLYTHITSEDDETSEYFILRSDFDDLINDIRETYISDKNIGLMSWLIDRAFRISPGMSPKKKGNLSKNRALLLKVLYEVNPKGLLYCFSKNINNGADQETLRADP